MAAATIVNRKFNFPFIDSDVTAVYDTNLMIENVLCANQTVASTSAVAKFNVRRCEKCAGRLQQQQQPSQPQQPTKNQPNNSAVGDGKDEDDTKSDDFDHLNGNGIVRMDMSKIIDSTGLPTYDAALKLESCGYV